jgi:hypothetical protein
MNPFEELGRLAAQLNDEGEFPTWLLRDIVAISDAPDHYRNHTWLIKTLIGQISNFDPYAGVGCFATSVSAESITATIRKIRSAE